MKTKSDQFALQPYKLTELAALYRINRNTMRDWLKKIEQHTGKRHGHYYNISQVSIIFLKLGEPGADDV